MRGLSDRADYTTSAPIQLLGFARCRLDLAINIPTVDTIIEPCQIQYSMIGATVISSK